MTSREPSRPSETHVLYSPGFPPWVGGLPNYMYERAKADPGRTVVVAADCPGAAEFDARQPFPVIRFAPARSVYRPRTSVPTKLLQISAALRTLTRVLRQRRPPVVEAVTLFPGGVAAAILKRRFDYQLVCYALGDDVLRPTHRWYARWLFQAAAKRVDRFIAISDFTRELLRSTGVENSRIRIIRPPLNTAQFAKSGARDHKRAGLPRDALVVLTVCHLVTKKNIHGVLNSVHRLAPKYPGLRYTIVGQGPDAERLKALAASLGLQSRVTFTGRISPEDLVDTLAGADVLVMPTLFNPSRGEVEGFGIVFLEAGSQGLPVIGPRYGGSADAVVDGETGYLVDPEDPVELDAKLSTLLDDPELRLRFGAAGRRRAFEPTDWSAATDFGPRENGRSPREPSV